jgi:hypothetical protein
VRRTHFKEANGREEHRMQSKHLKISMMGIIAVFLVLFMVAGHTEEHVKETEPRFTKAVYADEPLIRQIDEFLTMSREEIIEKLGPDYSVEPAGPEGAMDGYCYENLGMTFAFDPDSDVVELIDCDSNFKIHGVGPGSLFSEILEALGETEIVETWIELPVYTAYIARYKFGNSAYCFTAFEKDEPVHLLRSDQVIGDDVAE